MSENENVLRGHLAPYWEQGWEERIEFALYADGVNYPIFLESGQHLTIFDEAGSVLWTGKLKFVRRH